MAWSTLLGTLSAIVLVGFIVFAFRQGEKVRKGPDGTPPPYPGEQL
jgi:hypothetical protein